MRTLARDQFTVMNAEVISEETVSKVIVVVAAASRDFFAERQQFFVDLSKGLPIVDCDGVVAAIARDYVFAVG